MDTAEPGSERYWEERRAETRRPVMGGRIEGRLVNAEGNDVQFLLVDVSRKGVGIVAKRPVADGEVLRLETPLFPDTPLNLRVAWLKPILHEPNTFRCGLKLESEGDLEELFRSLNVILMD